MIMKFEYYDVIVKLLIIEKVMLVFDVNVYVFQVVKDLNKFVIKEVVEVLFNVKVKVVNIMIIKGKIKCFKGCFGVCLDVKKVYVMLEVGNSIDVFMGF